MTPETQAAEAQIRSLRRQLDEERARVERMRKFAHDCAYGDFSVSGSRAFEVLCYIAAGCPTDSGEEGGVG